MRFAFHAISHLGLLVLLFLPLSASADDIGDARAAFERGLALLDDERFADAASEFERSVEHHATASAHYNLGLALRGTGRLTAAVEAFEQVLSHYPGADAALRADALTLRDEVRARLARVTLDVRGDPDLVLLDGSPLERWAGELLLDPGDHVISVQREGFAPQEIEMSLASGEASELTIDASASPNPGRVYISVSPATAAIEVDGEARGEGALVLELSAGAHQLRVIAAGFVGQERRLNLRAGAVERLTFELLAFERRGEAESGVAPWVFVVLGSVAALVGFGIGLGVHLASPTAPVYEEGTLGRVFYNLSISF